MAHLLRRLLGVGQGPDEDGLHGGDGPLEGQLDVPARDGQPGRAEGGEQVPGP